MGQRAAGASTGDFWLNRLAAGSVHLPHREEVSFRRRSSSRQKPHRQQGKRRQSTSVEKQRLGDRDRHELEERSAHRKAQPSDADHANEDESVGRCDVASAIAGSGDQQTKRDEQPRERRRERSSSIGIGSC